MQVTVWLRSVQDDRLKKIIASSINNLPKGWKGVIDDTTTYKKGSDIDVIFGSWKNYDVEHHRLKREIVKNSKNVLILETPLLGRGPVSEVCQDDAFRVGLNGFMANTDWADIPDSRVEMLREKFNIPRKIIQRTGGDYILIPLQLPGDASLEGIDINQWAETTVKQIRDITDRKIVLRMPQIERNYNLDFTKNYKEIYFQKGGFSDKQVTLDNAYAVVTYSSGMSVEAILNGNRTFVDSNNGFASIPRTLESTLAKDYKNFLQEKHYDSFVKLICSTYWTSEEINNGEFWKYFFSYLGETDG